MNKHLASYAAVKCNSCTAESNCSFICFEAQQPICRLSYCAARWIHYPCVRFEAVIASTRRLNNTMMFSFVAFIQCFPSRALYPIFGCNRRILESKRRACAHGHVSATTIQRHYRGACARSDYTGMRIRWQVRSCELFCDVESSGVSFCLSLCLSVCMCVFVWVCVVASDQATRLRAANHRACVIWKKTRPPLNPVPSFFVSRKPTGHP